MGKRQSDTVALMDRVLRRVKRNEQAEIIVTNQADGLTRFADNQVTQNVASRTQDISLRLLFKGRSGRASGRQTSDAALDRLVQRAREGLVDGIGERPLPLISKKRYVKVHPKAGPRHLATPEGRGNAVAQIITRARRLGLEAAGIASFDSGILGIANTRGVRANHKIESGRVSITMTGKGGSGWADASGVKLSWAQIDALAQKAARICVTSARPRTVEPGAYTVILPPACIGDLLQFMAWYGLGAQSYQEGQSFLSGQMGKRLLSKHISIDDDAYHFESMGFPFDFEGVPRQRVKLIDRGLARGLVHDRRTARRARVRSTGHGLPEPNELGPIPLNLVMHPGRSSLESMIATTQKGLLITHFHYTNVMDPQKLVLTGLTRDGVFWVEKGKVRYPVKNFRFTESLLNAFNQVEAVGRRQVYTEGFFGGGFVVPSLKIKNFHFTSLAEEA